MLSMNEVIQNHPNRYVLVSVSERACDGKALSYNVINHDSKLEPMIEQMKSYPCPEEEIAIIPTFEQTEDDEFIVNGEVVHEVMPANLYAKFIRVHFGWG